MQNPNPNDVSYVEPNPDKTRFDFDVVKMTLEATRSAGCIAPFVVDKEPVNVKTKWGTERFNVHHNNFASAHCWISWKDVAQKKIHCDGINIVGKQINKDAKYGGMTDAVWNKPQERHELLLKTCVDTIVGNIDPDTGIEQKGVIVQ
jgi:hypothetical protein